MTTGGSDLRGGRRAASASTSSPSAAPTTSTAAGASSSRNHELQSDNLPAEAGGRDAHGPEATHTDQINDYGFDLGGPIVKDKLWFWGVLRQERHPHHRASAGTSDKTHAQELERQAELAGRRRTTCSRSSASTAPRSRSAARPASPPTRPTRFLWNQGNFYPEEDCGLPCGMHGLWKAEWNHTFSSNFNLNAKYAYFGWGYGFDAATAARATRTAAGLRHRHGLRVLQRTSPPASPGTSRTSTATTSTPAGAASTSSSSASAIARTRPAPRPPTAATRSRGIDNGGGDTVAQVWRQRNVAFTEDDSERLRRRHLHQGPR